jgi:hypothetical protein
MSNFPDFLGDRIWALASVLVEQRQFPCEEKVSHANFRHQILNSNKLMTLIAKEGNIKPKLEQRHNYHKRYASGLELALGTEANKQGIQTALGYAVELLEKYVNFKTLKEVSEKRSGKQLQKQNSINARKFLILESDCF